MRLHPNSVADHWGPVVVDRKVADGIGAKRPITNNTGELSAIMPLSGSSLSQVPEHLGPLKF